MYICYSYPSPTYPNVVVTSYNPYVFYYSILNLVCYELHSNFTSDLLICQMSLTNELSIMHYSQIVRYSNHVSFENSQVPPS